MFSLWLTCPRILTLKGGDGDTFPPRKTCHSWLEGFPQGDFNATITLGKTLMHPKRQGLPFLYTLSNIYLKGNYVSKMTHFHFVGNHSSVEPTIVHVTISLSMLFTFEKQIMSSYTVITEKDP